MLGFEALQQALPQQVGTCLEDQHFSGNGDAVQHTSGGLLVWRKSDNWTAFTDGDQTWVNGPSGIAKRINSERFDWELQANPSERGQFKVVVTTAKSPGPAASLGPLINIV
ncbi:MAG TPA: hypothetical protein VKU60_02285, partial [Chloroflexota bacterium]|nr:hypothetical protein [Chloroflexota bacterium]